MQAHIIFNTICILRFFYSHRRHQTYECQQYRDAKNTGYFTEMTQPSKKEDDAELPKATAEMVGPGHRCTCLSCFQTAHSSLCSQVPYMWLSKNKNRS